MASTIVVDKIKSTSGTTFTLPTADGSAGHLLKTNGSAVLSFVADTDTGITDLVQDTTPQLGGDLSCNSSQIQWSKGADVASATALVLLTDGNYFDVTGTTTVTSFNTTAVGTQIKLHFDGACILTHHSSDLVLPSGANITTAAGDEAEFIEYASGDYRCTSYTRATGKAVIASHTATVGKATIWIPANAMKETESNGCASITSVETTAGRPDMMVLDFDKDADEAAQFQVCFPKSWNLGTVTFQVWWAGLAATTGVAWGLQGVSVSDNSTIDVAYGTAIIVTDDAQGAVEEALVTAESGAVTIAGSPADNDVCFFRIFRDVSDGNDDMAGDARLIGCKLFFTTDAENDS
jgi:hypothetical protein